MHYPGSDMVVSGSAIDNARRNLAKLRETRERLAKEIDADPRASRRERNALNRIQEKMFRAEMLIEVAGARHENWIKRAGERHGMRRRLAEIRVRIGETPTPEDT